MTANFNIFSKMSEESLGVLVIVQLVTAVRVVLEVIGLEEGDIVVGDA